MPPLTVASPPYGAAARRWRQRRHHCRDHSSPGGKKATCRRRTCRRTSPLPPPVAGCAPCRPTRKIPAISRNSGGRKSRVRMPPSWALWKGPHLRRRSLREVVKCSTRNIGARRCPEFAGFPAISTRDRPDFDSLTSHHVFGTHG